MRLPIVARGARSGRRRILPTNLIASLLFLLSAVGCGATVQSAAKDATAAAVPTAVDQGLKAVEDQATRDRIVRLMETPEMQKTIEQVSASVARGVTQGLTDEQAAAKATEIASAIATAATRIAIDAALAEANSPANEDRIEQIATSAADAATRAAIRAMGAELPTVLGPAIGTILREDAAPALHGLVTGPEIRDALSQVAFEMSRQAVLGSNQALAEIEQRKPKKGLLARVTTLFVEGGWLLWVLVGVSFLSVVGLVVALVRSREREKRFRAEAAPARLSVARPSREVS